MRACVLAHMFLTDIFTMFIPTQIPFSHYSFSISFFTFCDFYSSYISLTRYFFFFILNKFSVTLGGNEKPTRPQKENNKTVLNCTSRISLSVLNRPNLGERERVCVCVCQTAREREKARTFRFKN